MPARSVIRSSLVTLAAVALLVVGIPAAAHAAPNCSQVPAPPACGSAPTPKPVPAPSGFSSSRFTVDFTEQNVFTLVIQNVPPAAVAGLADTQLSSYRASISCTNGFFYSGRLARGGVSAPTLSFVTTMPASATGSGSCLATTWDASTLAVSGSSVARFANPHTPFGSTWGILFD